MKQFSQKKRNNHHFSGLPLPHSKNRKKQINQHMVNQLRHVSHSEQENPSKLCPEIENEARQLRAEKSCCINMNEARRSYVTVFNFPHVIHFGGKFLQDSRL